MTPPPDEPDLRIAEEVLPEPVDDLAVPLRLDTLSPWHRPRKQLVRENQWLYLSRRLIEREMGQPGSLHPPNGDPEICYLTFPGIDYLDVRQLADVCRELGCRLTSTGFQSGEENNPYIARAQLREKSLIDAGHISRHSHTFARLFEDITHTDGHAYRELKRKGPFHIVNIDACGSIAPPTANHARRLIDAIYRTIELQLQTMTGRWLLFVTTDARPDSIAKETLSGFCEAIFSNASANQDFRSQATPLFSSEETDIRAAVTKASENAGEVFLRLFSLGLAKWILKLVRSKKWDMQTHHPYCYSTMPRDDETPSMVCLAFEFLPPPRGLLDPLRVTHAQPAPTPERENTSIRAVDKIRDMTNADSKIRSDEPLRLRMIENLRELLKEAGYDPATLRKIGT